MLHFAPESQSFEAPEPYAEALARLAGIRHALRLVDPFGGGPASDPAGERFGETLAAAPPARQRCFDRSTSGTISAAAAGLEALVAEQSAGREPHHAASRKLTEEIRRSLEDVSRLMFAA